VEATPFQIANIKKEKRSSRWLSVIMLNSQSNKIEESQIGPKKEYIWFN